MITNSDNTSLEAHEAYCNEIDKISRERFGVNACDLLDDESLACGLIQDGWCNDTPPNLVVDTLKKHQVQSKESTMSHTICKVKLDRITNKISALFYQHPNAYGRVDYINNDSLNMTFRTGSSEHNYSTHLAFDFNTMLFSGSFMRFSSEDNPSAKHIKFKDIAELQNLKCSESFSNDITETLKSQMLEFVLKVTNETQ